MKKIILYFSVFIWALAMGSCSDVLETAPPTRPSEATFWKTQSDYEKALAACYTVIGQSSNSRLSCFMQAYDCMTDNAYRGSGGTGDYSTEYYVTGLLNPTSTGHVTELYMEAYRAIARINIFMHQLELAENTGITDDGKKNMMAEAYFLRGYCYWMLYLFYGEVPVVTEPLTIENQVQPKKSRVEVYEHAIADLQYAIDNFTQDQTYKQAGGHATKGAARGLKARMLMFNAFDANGSAIRAEIEKAYNELNLITGYSLNPEYSYNFYPDMQEASPEIIFSIKYLSPNSYHDNDRIFGLDNGMYPTQDFFDAFSPGDTRRLKTFAEERTHTWIGRPTVTFPESTTRYGYRRPIKGVSPLPLPSGDEIWGKEDRADYDAIILRWGELMLLKAEAAVELDLLSVAKDLVDQIRDRQTTLPHLPDGLSQAQMRDSVRHERRVEAGYESGLRYYDLKRWGTMEQRLKETFANDPDFSNLRPTWTKATHYDLPLPQAEIDKSNGVLIQNPIYTNR